MMDNTANPMMMGGATGMMTPGAPMMMGNPAGGMMMANFGYPMMMQQPQPALQQPSAFGPGAFVEPYDFCKTQPAQQPMMQQAPGMMYSANIMRSPYNMGGAPMMMMNQGAFPGANPAAAAAAAQPQPFVNPNDGAAPNFAAVAPSTGAKVKLGGKPKSRAVQYERKVN